MMQQKILIVEDEVNIREVYAEVLRDAGFYVIESPDGQEGESKALEGDWDLLLLDIMLPKKDGLEVLAQIKKVPALQNKPIIILTNLGRDSIIKEGYSLGASGYLIKSDIDPGQVVDSVKNLLVSHD